MCSPMQCEKCKKMTWYGCGMHVEEALGGVPEADRCECDAELLTWVPKY